jgi:hypothetical protein
MGKILFAEQSSAPSTPGSGYVAVYAKTDGKLYYKDDAGTEYLIGGGGGGIDSGTSFPASPSAGDMFYRTDLREMAYYDGTRWVGDPFLLPLANYNAFAQNVTSNVTLYGGALPNFSVLVESLLISWSCSSADVSNYWTVNFYQGDSSGFTLMSSTVLNTTWANFTQTVVTSFTANPIAASKNNLSIYVSKTGSPNPVSLMVSLFVRRVF